MRHGGVSESNVPIYREVRRRAGAVNLGSDNAEKWRSLKPSIGLRLHYNKMQDEDGLEGIMDAVSDTTVIPHMSTILMTRFNATVQEGRWTIKKEVKVKKQKPVLTDASEGYLLYPKVLPHALKWCSKESEFEACGVVSERPHLWNFWSLII